MHKRAQQIVLGVQLALVLLVSLFLAMGVNGLLAATLTSLTPTAVGAPAVDDEAAKRPQPQQANAGQNALIYNRNLFNQGAAEPEPAPMDEAAAIDEAAPTEEEELAATADPAPGRPVPTDLQVLLIGTQVNESPEWSIAILQDIEASAGQQAMYERTGATVKDDATIVWIDRGRVYFKRHSRGNRIEYIDIDTTEQDIKKRAAEAKKAKPKSRSTRGAEKDGDDGRSRPSARGGSAGTSRPSARTARAGNIDPNAIEPMGKGTYGVPRDMAEQVRNNPKLLKNASKYGQPPQIQPVYSGGGVSGFRVLGVQSGSLYSKLGIRNGDIIMNVNGKVVDNPQKALAFFDQLGPNQDVGVKINRRGRHQTLTYKLK